MEIQKAILLFFSSIHNTVLDSVAKFFTFFGEDVPLIVIMLFIYWCIDKKKGFVSCFILITASEIMSTIKAVVRFPRPWTVMPELDTQRIETATGYSFPSGHTTNSSSAFSSLAISFKKKWFSIVSAVLIVCVGLSRNYLCCHWPMDVIVGWIVGIGTSVVMISHMDKILNNRKLLLILGLGMSVVAVVCSLLLCGEKIDYTAFSDFSKVFAMGGALCIGYLLETKLFDFSIETGSWKKKIARYLIGMAGMVLILPLSKPLLQKIGIYNPFTAQLRYYLTAIWACMWPVIGNKLGLFTSSDKQ